MLSRVAQIRDLLRDGFRWRGDRTDPDYRADPTGWWRDAQTLQLLGPALAALNTSGEEPTVVLAPQSRGTLLGALVATHLRLGLVEVRKDPRPAADSDVWRVRTTPPDYRDRHLEMGFRKALVKSGDRVLFVDDWIATGGQALTTRALVAEAGATWLGAAVIVDALETPSARRQLVLKSLLRVHDLI